MSKGTVYVEKGAVAYEQMFVNNGFTITKTLDDADILCLIGGDDVQPALYGHEKHYTTMCDPTWDVTTGLLYQEAQKKGIFVVGICRGGQYLNVANGGVMWQHVENHGMPHKATDLLTGEEFYVSSTHHQMMCPPKDADLIMVGEEKQTIGIIFDTEDFTFRERVIPEDVEAVWFPKTRSFAFQPHPEYPGYDECCFVFFRLLDELMG